MQDEKTAKQAYDDLGFHLARGVLSVSQTSAVLENLATTVERVTGQRFDPSGSEIADFFNTDVAAQTSVYNAFRGNAALRKLAEDDAVVSIVRELFDFNEIDLLEKMPFRIDTPHEVKELAVWHQDHFYVGGDPRTMTVWVPFQDTFYSRGCLAIMPESHSLGALAHSNMVLGKRHFPDDIFDREVRLVEMKLGDVLFFDGCLLHCGGVNLSDCVRYSTQPRYVRRDRASDSVMGQRIPLQ